MTRASFDALRGGLPYSPAAPAAHAFPAGPDGAATPAAPPQSRIIAAESVQEVRAFTLAELTAPGRQPAPLRARDLDTEVGRAAFAMGRKRGWEEGHRAGREQGLRDGVQVLSDGKIKAVAETTRQLQALVDEFRGELGRLETELADRVVTLAVDIAREVLRRELATDPRALLPALGEALRALGEGAGRLELHVNPQDAALLRSHLQAQPGLPHWQVHEDASIRAGGCRVEADTGVVDARLDSRWQAVMDALGRPEEMLP